MEFTEFPKIPRLNREVIITEKIDGTNASVTIVDAIQQPHAFALKGPRGHWIICGSRSRFIHPDADNFGFARWVQTNIAQIETMGPGQHFGEWWGQGIQRGYGLTEKRWSLFNTARWGTERPECCHVVPVIAQGIGIDSLVSTATERLRALGSAAAPGFMKPEGIVVFHTAANSGFKVTLEKDAEHKSQTRAA